MYACKLFANLLLKSGMCRVRVILAMLPLSFSVLLAGMLPTANAQSDSTNETQTQANFPSSSLVLLAAHQQQDANFNESGELMAVSIVDIRAPFDSTILESTAEGKIVKKGDLLVKLDTTGLDEQREQSQVSITRLELQMVRLEKQAKQVERQLEIQGKYRSLLGEVVKQQREALSGKDGELATELKLLEAKKQQAANHLEFAKTRHELLVAAHKKGAIAPDEVAQSAAELSNAESELLVIALESDLLAKSRPLKLAELELRTAEKDLNSISEIEALKDKAAALAAEQEATKLNSQLETDNLKKIEDKIKSAVIVAPADGLVSYLNFRSPRGEIREGREVRERQPILRIIDMSRLQVRLLVEETEIAKVKKDQKVNIRFGAFPDQIFEGTVTEVGTLPFPGRIGPKVYLVLVSLSEPSKELRIGMTAIVEFKAE